MQFANRLPSALIVKICSDAHIYDDRKGGNALKLFSYWSVERNTKRNELQFSTKENNIKRLKDIYSEFREDFVDHYEYEYDEDDEEEDDEEEDDEEAGEDESSEDESGEDESDEDEYEPE